MKIAPGTDFLITFKLLSFNSDCYLSTIVESGGFARGRKQGNASSYSSAAPSPVAPAFLTCLPRTQMLTLA